MFVGQLKEELDVGNTFCLKPIELPYFHVVVQHVSPVVEVEYPFNGGSTVIKAPEWVVLPTHPNPAPDMFVGTPRIISRDFCHLVFTLGASSCNGFRKPERRITKA